MVNCKLIPRNFGHIGHLPGSKMIDVTDKLLHENEITKFTVCKRDKDDLVIITEKIDGMNAGVVKKNGMLYPINRKGYDSREMGIHCSDLQVLGDTWAEWVDQYYSIYDVMLKEGERLVFENCIIQHTLQYKFKDDPVFLLAKYSADNKRLDYKSLTRIAKYYKIPQPPLLNMGAAIPPQIILNQFPKGCVGVRGEIEGIVYTYEHNGQFESNAKFVSNKLIGTIHPQTTKFNRYKIWQDIV